MNNVIAKLSAMAAAVLLLTVISPAGASIVEQFTYSASGWLTPTINNGGVVHMRDVDFHAPGGNGGGYVSGDVPKAGNRLYGLQPENASAFGDMTGLTMTADYKIDGAVTGPDNPKVRFYVGTMTGGYNYFVTKDEFSWDPNADTDWATHSVALYAGNFVEWPNQAAHSRTFAQVIAAPEDIGLVFTGDISQFGQNASLGFSSAQGATIGIDNFGATGVAPVPEPMTAVALALGLPLAFRRRR